MQRRNALFLSLAAGLAATLALVLSSPEIEAPPVAPVAREPGEATPTLRATEPTAAGPLPASVPRVRVEVVSKERYVPPSPVRAVAVRAGDGAELPTQLLAGAGAGFDASPRAVGAALVAIEHPEGRVLRQVALVAGELARPVVGTRLVVRGRVRDADRKPVADSRVWFGEFDAAGDRREVATDGEGAFRAEVLAGAGVPFVVGAPGFATEWRVLTVEAPPVPREVVLARGCVLEVQIAALAVAMPEARVFVVPRPAVATGVAMWPFFLQALDDGQAVDGSGRAVVDGLPASGEVGVIVRHPRAALAAAQPVTLKGERVRTTVPIEFAPGVWQGLVVDDGGQALPGVAVWARAAGGVLESGTSQRLVPPHLEQRGAFCGFTDLAGAFTVGAPSSPSAVLSLRLSGCAGRDLEGSQLPVGKPIVLPAWRGGEVELRLSPPRAGTVWSAEADLAGGVREVLAEDQPWRISLPHAGRFDFVVSTFVGDELRGRERHDDVHATGAVELQAPKLP